MSNLGLLRICKSVGIRAIAKDDHLAHELVEIAVNIKISQKDFQISVQENGEREILEKLTEIEQELLAQSWRSEEEMRLQQFSTSPVAFLMTKF
jgi:hypothetical protein